jgi:dTDP-4-dehydrorhamnose reductase
MRIAITGAGGQLGQALQRRLADRPLLPLTHAMLEITDLAAVLATIEAYRPTVIIHTAAATNVDGCESQPERTFQVNGLGSRNLAIAAARVGASLVYLSTNYVFDGLAEQPYHEQAPTNPISVYGAAKLAGEQYVRELAGGRHYIVRTTWLYAEQGRNLVQTILRLAGERSELQFVDDQLGQPTYAADLASAIAQLIEQPAYGTYHFTNSGACSPYTLATTLLRLIGHRATIVHPIPASAYPRPARPPANGVLLNWAGAALGITLRPWEEALAACLATTPPGR